MKYFSMFSGIGGFELGIQRAALSVRNGQTENTEPGTSEQGMESATESLQSNRNSTDTELRRNTGSVSCVGYSEIDKYAIKVYERQFGRYESCDEHAHISEESEQEERTQRGEWSVDQHEVQLHTGNRTAPLCNRCKGHRNYGDATAINAKDLPDFDLLVGGFPCQAFSIAGKRAGFDDTRGTLFFDIARILKEKQPRHLVLENVKGLLSHDSGRTFTTIIGVLTDLGYLVEWQVLNSKDFGVPQNRERVFIVGHLGNGCGRQVFPISGNDQQTIESGLATVSAVTGMKRVELSPTLDTMYKKGLGSKQARPAVIEQINQPTHSNDRVYADTGISPTLNTMQGGNRQPLIEQSPRIRRLTPLECERLQGFPDYWTQIGQEKKSVNGHEMDAYVEISDTQRYKMCGNAVTVNVVEAVMRGLIPCL